MSLVEVSRKLSRRVQKLSFQEPVTHTYNPLSYARKPHERYLEQYGSGPKPVILVGMNPGPFGMAQTGVPFGDVGMVRDWLAIDEPVGNPQNQHPKRPILGFECSRKEVSGSRLWGWAQERFTTPQRFFQQFFVVNYCPLIFLEEGGRNRTPDKLPAEERAALFRHCDDALAETIAQLSPLHVVGIGGFALRRVTELMAASMYNLPAFRVSVILHPSPANPHANRGWAPRIEEQLQEAGVSIPGA